MPGSTTVPVRVDQTMTEPVVDHRGPKFAARTKQLLPQGLVKVADTLRDWMAAVSWRRLGVYLNPFVALPFGSAAASSISVDQGTSLYDLVRAAVALRDPQTGTVPIADANYVTANAGDAVLWNRAEALALFGALKDGKAVPPGLLSGTKVG